MKKSDCSSRRQRSTAIFWLAFCLVLCSCSGNWDCPDARPILPDPKLTLVSDKAARYTHVAWVGDDVIFEYAEQYYPRLGEGRLWQMRSDGTEMEQLQLPNYPTCKKSDFVSPQRMQDGRLGYGVLCIDNGKIKTYMMAYDFKTGHGTPLTSYPLPVDVRYVGRDSWNPGATLGIVGSKVGNSVDSQMWWLGQGLWSPVRLDVDVAMNPIWSPNGKMIAFTGIVKQGEESAWQSVQEIFLMDRNGSNVRSLAKGFKYPIDWAWSPDNRWLALSATFNEQSTETDGIWLIEVATGRHQLVAKGYYPSLDWSGSGRKIVLQGPPPINEQNLDVCGIPFNTRLYLLDVTSAVAQ